MSDNPYTQVPVHPLYARDREDMEFLYWSHRGGAGYLSRYLTRHPKEHLADYAIRLKRAVYPNLIKVQVSAYASQVYRSPVSRQFEAKGARAKRIVQVCELVASNADRFGNAADEFYEQVLTLAQRDGMCGVLVDRTRTAERALTVEQEAAQGVRPYCVVVPRADLIDWEFDDDGRPVWVILRTGSGKVREPLAKRDANAKSEERYRLWTRTTSREIVWDKEAGDWRPGEEIIHGLGIVPIEFVFWGLREGKEPVGASAIEDLAPMCRRLVHLMSLIDEECFLQVFNMLCVGPTTYETMNDTSWSTSGVLKIVEGEPAPMYLAPDVETVGALAQQINDAVRWIRILSGNVGATVDGGFVPPSGVSMSYQSSDKFALFKKIGGRMEDLESRVFGLCALWEGGTVDDLTCNIAYPVDFDPVLVAKSMEDSLAFAALGIEGDALTEVHIQAIRRILNSSLDPKRIDEICDGYRAARTQGASGAGATSATALEPQPADTATTGDDGATPDAGLGL